MSLILVESEMDLADCHAWRAGENPGLWFTDFFLVKF